MYTAIGLGKSRNNRQNANARVDASFRVRLAAALAYQSQDYEFSLSPLIGIQILRARLKSGVQREGQQPENRKGLMRLCCRSANAAQTLIGPSPANAFKPRS